MSKQIVFERPPVITACRFGFQNEELRQLITRERKAIMNSTGHINSESIRHATQQPDSAAADTSSTSWRSRKLTFCALALGGAAIATYRNHEATCPLWRSILSYAAWQTPALIYYLGTEPLNFASPGAQLANTLLSSVKEELNVPYDRGICVAASAVWLSLPLSTRSNPAISHIPDCFASNKIAEALALVYPGYQLGDYTFSAVGLDEFFGKYGLKRLEKLLIPSVLGMQGSHDADSAADSQCVRAEFEQHTKHLQALNLRLVDAIPLDQLAIGESYAAVMSGVNEDTTRSHMIGISRIADGFTIYDPEMGIPMKSDSVENCLIQLGKVEEVHQKKLFFFLRYQGSELEFDAQKAI